LNPGLPSRSLDRTGLITLLDLLLVSFSLIFLFVPCCGPSWLHVCFLLHVKYTISYRIVSYCIVWLNNFSTFIQLSNDESIIAVRICIVRDYAGCLIQGRFYIWGGGGHMPAECWPSSSIPPVTSPGFCAKRHGMHVHKVTEIST